MDKTEEVGIGWLDLFRGGRAPLVIALTLGIWLHAADSLLVVTTLPSAVIEIGGDTYVAWSYTLYMLASILIGATTGLIALKLGLRIAFVTAGVFFAIGCVISAVAPDMAVMLIGRFIQGMGGGGQLALVYVALDRLFPNAMMPKLVALTSAVWSMSAFCGPLVGGLFASFGLWRGAYCAFALQAVLFVILVLVAVPHGRCNDEPDVSGGLPLLRLALLSGGILLISAAGSDPVLAPLMVLGSIACFGFFLRCDARSDDNRMLPPHPFSRTTLYGAGLLMAFFLATATSSLFTYGPFFLERLFGVSPLESGYIIAMESVAWGVAAIAIANATLAAERWLIRTGPLVVLIGLVGLAVTMPQGQIWPIMPFVLMLGAGFGQMWGLVIRRVTESAAPDDRERTSAAFPTVQQFGYAVGAALCSLIANALGFAEDAPAETLRPISVWIFAAFVPVALIAFWAAWRLGADPEDGEMS
ncbi:MAG: MFS transporter [Rhodospirillaceae bacterium]|nr:MFS transporter [Rhodospirillaceae bacterium]